MVVMTNEEKETRYRKVDEACSAVLGPPDGYDVSSVGQMATVCSLLREQLPYFLFCGFYRVFPGKVDKRGRKQLEIGPYQASNVLACGTIAFGRGVCGDSAVAEKTVVVDDVKDYPNYIACDGETQSEIVVPVFDQQGKLAAVLDVDSEETGSFNEVDQKWLEKICTYVVIPDVNTQLLGENGAMDAHRLGDGHTLYAYEMCVHSIAIRAAYGLRGVPLRVVFLQRGDAAFAVSLTGKIDAQMPILRTQEGQVKSGEDAVATAIAALPLPQPSADLTSCVNAIRDASFPLIPVLTVSHTGAFTHIPLHHFPSPDLNNAMCYLPGSWMRICQSSIPRVPPST
eukprot:GFYU01014282.1.p1 GENE.GFYU01014282.1~~GFYU01014282.1.p1  ORF type:complete len:373 (-),score=83.06 GFYU01014282.1:435-1457(-)